MSGRGVRAAEHEDPRVTSPAEVTGEVDDPEVSGGPVVFDPARTVDGIGLSDDPILRFRPSAYSESVSRRQ